MIDWYPLTSRMSPLVTSYSSAMSTSYRWMKSSGMLILLRNSIPSMFSVIILYVYCIDALCNMLEEGEGTLLVCFEFRFSFYYDSEYVVWCCHSLFWVIWTTYIGRSLVLDCPSLGVLIANFVERVAPFHLILLTHQFIVHMLCFWCFSWGPVALRILLLCVIWLNSRLFAVKSFFCHFVAPRGRLLSVHYELFWDQVLMCCSRWLSVDLISLFLCALCMCVFVWVWEFVLYSGLTLQPALCFDFRLFRYHCLMGIADCIGYNISPWWPLSVWWGGQSLLPWAIDFLMSRFIAPIAGRWLPVMCNHNAVTRNCQVGRHLLF